MPRKRALRHYNPVGLQHLLDNMFAVSSPGPALEVYVSSLRIVSNLPPRILQNKTSTLQIKVFPAIL